MGYITNNSHIQPLYFSFFFFNTIKVKKSLGGMFMRPIAGINYTDWKMAS